MSSPRAVALTLAAFVLGATSVLAMRARSAAATNPPRVDFVTIPVDNLSGISYDGNSLWLTVDGAGLIHDVDPATLKIRRTLSFPSKATGGSAWDGHSLWQLAYQDRTISRIDPKSGAIEEVIPSPGAGQCSGMTFDGRYLWVANFDEEKIYQIDPQNKGAIVRSVAGNHELTGIAWDGRSLWFGLVIPPKDQPEAAARLGVVEQMNLADQEILRSFPVSGVGPGTSDWTPKNKTATQFWWYDGYHHRLARIRLGSS